MPIYEYKCDKCGTKFEEIVFPSDNKEIFSCPRCGYKDTKRLISSFTCGSSETTGGLDKSLSKGCIPSGGFS